MKANILLAIILSTAFVACGRSPGQQSDRVEKELQKTVDEKQRILSPLVGRYEGLIKRTNGKENKVVIQIVPTITRAMNPGRNDFTELPDLGGNVNLYLDDTDLNVLPIAQFSTASYDEDSKELVMSGYINTGSSLGAVLTTLSGTVHDQKIVATLINGTLGTVGVIEAVKVTQDGE